MSLEKLFASFLLVEKELLEGCTVVTVDKMAHDSSVTSLCEKHADLIGMRDDTGRDVNYFWFAKKSAFEEMLQANNIDLDRVRKIQGVEVSVDTDIFPIEFVASGFDNQTD